MRVHLDEEIKSEKLFVGFHDLLYRVFYSKGEMVGSEDEAVALVYLRECVVLYAALLVDEEVETPQRTDDFEFPLARPLVGHWVGIEAPDGCVFDGVVRIGIAGALAEKVVVDVFDPLVERDLSEAEA